MKKVVHTIGLLTMFLFITPRLPAQLGQTPEQCNIAWCSTGEGQLDEAGNGTLRYHARGTDMHLHFQANTLVKATYRKNNISEHDISHFLNINKQGMEWHKWIPPGIPPENIRSNLWLRDDENASATLKNHILEILCMAIPEQNVKPTSPPVESKKSASNETTSKQPALRPDSLPAPGDSRSQAIALLGSPSGSMMANGKEILIYRWGRVCIRNNKVYSIN